MLRTWIRLPGYRGGTLVFTNGCFDLLHDGHRYLLNRAKAQGEYLVVGVNSDDSVRRRKGSDRPVQSETIRLSHVADDPCVDYVLVFDEDTPEKVLHELRPDVYVLGEEYRANCPGAEFAGRVHFVERLPGLSTTKIIEAATLAES